MSAYLIETDHLAELVKWSFMRRVGSTSAGHFHGFNPNNRELLNDWNMEDVVICLANENFDSLEYRYKDDHYSDKEREDYIAEVIQKARSAHIFCDDALSIYNMAKCYDYQACERDDYYQSNARAYIYAIKQQALTYLIRECELSREARGVEFSEWDFKKPATSSGISLHTLVTRGNS